MKFIHAADVHLDSPLIGLERYEGAPVDEVRLATRLALENLVELAIAEDVALVLLAGDIYDGDWKDYNTGLFFTSQMARLREAGIEVCLVAGNHDAASQITRHLRLPANVRALSVAGPETVLLEDLGVAVHGQGFATRAVTDNVVVRYPTRANDFFNIGLLHTSADGREGHEPYAPCSLQNLMSTEYDYWALGHVHRREVLSKEPWIIFPGNTQGRNARELGPKGCTLVTVDDGGVTSVEHRDLDTVRWAACDVDASGAVAGDEVLDRAEHAVSRTVAENPSCTLALRIRISGSCRAHRDLTAKGDHWSAQIRTLATDISDGRAWIEKVLVETSPKLGQARTSAAGDAIGTLLNAIDDFESNAEVVEQVIGELRAFEHRLPSELRMGEDALDIESAEDLRGTIAGARELLLHRILDEEVTVDEDTQT